MNRLILLIVTAGFISPKQSQVQVGYSVRADSERHDDGLERHDDCSLGTASGQRQDSNDQLGYSKESTGRLISLILILLDSQHSPLESAVLIFGVLRIYIYLDY